MAATPTQDPNATKPWQASLTVKGAAIAGASALVLSYGPGLLHLAGVDPVSATEATKDLAGILSGVGGLVALVGRMRLGGLH